MNPRHGLRVPSPLYGDRADERGLTLTELTLVGILATIVMFALTTFYFNSQNLWIDGSTQVLAQRDATLLVNQLRRHIHEARQATVDPDPANPECDHLTLEYAPTKTIEYRWKDGKVHLLEDGEDKGPAIDTPIVRFRLIKHGTTTVELLEAVLETAQGDKVTIASRFALLGQ